MPFEARRCVNCCASADGTSAETSKSWIAWEDVLEVEGDPVEGEGGSCARRSVLRPPLNFVLPYHMTYRVTPQLSLHITFVSSDGCQGLSQGSVAGVALIGPQPGSECTYG